MPPPLPPPPPIEFIQDNNRFLVRRYGVIAHPYYRKILYGPVFIENEHVQSRKIYYVSEDESGHGSTNINNIIEWTDETHLGHFDPNYPPVYDVQRKQYYNGMRMRQNKFHKGMRVITRHGEEAIIIDEPFLIAVRDLYDEDIPTIAYYVESNGRRGVIVEDSLREHPENLERRKNYGQKHTAKANRLNALRNIMTDKLSTISVPITENKGLGLENTRKMRNIHLPTNITKHIAEFAYGNRKYTNVLAGNAHILGANNPPKPSGIKLGGKRRTRRRAKP